MVLAFDKPCNDWFLLLHLQVARLPITDRGVPAARSI